MSSNPTSLFRLWDRVVAARATLPPGTDRSIVFTVIALSGEIVTIESEAGDRFWCLADQIDPASFHAEW